jgi:hypothetical protein
MQMQHPKQHPSSPLLQPIMDKLADVTYRHLSLTIFPKAPQTNGAEKPKLSQVGVGTLTAHRITNKALDSLTQKNPNGIDQ